MFRVTEKLWSNMTLIMKFHNGTWTFLCNPVLASVSSIVGFAYLQEFCKQSIIQLIQLVLASLDYLLKCWKISYFENSSPIWKVFPRILKVKIPTDWFQFPLQTLIYYESKNMQMYDKVKSLQDSTSLSLPWSPVNSLKKLFNITIIH